MRRGIIKSYPSVSTERPQSTLGLICGMLGAAAMVAVFTLVLLIDDGNNNHQANKVKTAFSLRNSSHLFHNVKVSSDHATNIDRAPFFNATLSSQDYWSLHFIDSPTSHQIPAKNSSKFLCLKGEFSGGNANRIIELANLLEMKREVGLSKVALNPLWSKWFRKWFDPIDNEIILDVEAESKWCDTHVLAEDALTLRNKRAGNPILPYFIPKLSIRQEAEKATEKLKQKLKSSSFISVHRRSFELVDCTGIAARGNDFFYCFGNNVPLDVRERAGYCNVTYADILRRDAKTGNHEKLLVLFTDGQRPEFDSTFPIVDNHPFTVQMWMWVLSDVHYANPMSSADYIVAHWRRGNGIQPRECYKAYPDFVGV